MTTKATFLVIGKAKYLFISFATPKAFLQWFWIAEGLVWLGLFSLWLDLVSSTAW